MSEKVVPVSTYLTIFFALLVLTGTTYTVAKIDLGIMNTVAALLIAGCKASLVAIFFMHLKYSPRLMRLVLLGSLFWLGIMLLITMSDYLTRGGFRYPGHV
ncbi:MAG TPA: cytochrome C oxidase subunit IV family protein [Blastocatellia bacterium]|nr:cytochrome C oxidase subunit IV family protein [Blastocatellia bacterium]